MTLKSYETSVVDVLIRKLLVAGTPVDIAKYALPECYKTELTWTINARSLQNFLTLRSDKSALWEIRDLAKEIYKATPDNHKYLFKSYIKETHNDPKRANLMLLFSCIFSLVIL